MEGRVKARPPGSIPNSLGRQVGVLPINGSSKTRRKNSGSGSATSIPVGGTNIPPAEFDQSCLQTASPATSSSSSIQSFSSRQSSRSTQLVRNGSKRSPNPDTTTNSFQHDSNSSKVHGIPPSVSKGGDTPSSASKGQARPSSGSKGRPSDKTSGFTALPPSSSRSTKSSTRSQNSRMTSETAGKSPASSASASGSLRRTSDVQRKSPGSSSSYSKLSGKSSQNDAPPDEDNMIGQEINFINIPSSRPGSKVKKGSGSSRGSISERGSETGRKPHRTVDPEEILAQNMESDFNKIYNINQHACELTVIDNMEKFRKVKVLDLSCNFIDQIQNLEFNKDLKELKLYDNRLRKIEGLENLKDLSTLQLQHNKIKSIGKSLTSLKKLKNLRIDCNQLLKIETFELSPCVQLTVVDVSYNMLDSLAALNYLPNLEELNASGNRLRTVSDLSKCKQLGELDLSRNRITDLSGVRGLPKLLTLNISHNHLTSLKSMGRLKLLQDLFATNNQIHELSTVATQLPAVEVLDLTQNEITDWDEFYSLEEMSQLVELFISGNPFCAEDGDMPHYHSAIQAVLPDLEIIDGAHIKKHVAKGAPLMRPMSASSIVSLRQMDTQMRSADEQMQSLEKSLEEKFAALRTNCDALPIEPPNSSRVFSGMSDLSGSRPTTSSSRSRILQARKFAASVDLE